MGEQLEEEEPSRTVGIRVRQKRFTISLKEKEELVNVVFWDTAGIFYFKALTEAYTL